MSERAPVNEQMYPESYVMARENDWKQRLAAAEARAAEAEGRLAYAASAEQELYDYMVAVERERDQLRAAQAQAAGYRGALEELKRWHLPDGDCWCETPETHSPGCQLARAAFAEPPAASVECPCACHLWPYQETGQGVPVPDHFQDDCPCKKPPAASLVPLDERAVRQVIVDECQDGAWSTNSKRLDATRLARAIATRFGTASPAAGEEASAKSHAHT